MGIKSDESHMCVGKVSHIYSIARYFEPTDQHVLVGYHQATWTFDLTSTKRLPKPSITYRVFQGPRCIYHPPSLSTMPPTTAFTGPYRGLVLSFDIGTTFSGAAYAILDPGQIPKILPITRYVVPLINTPMLANPCLTSIAKVPWTRKRRFQDTFGAVLLSRWDFTRSRS